MWCKMSAQETMFRNLVQHVALGSKYDLVAMFWFSLLVNTADVLRIRDMSLVMIKVLSVKIRAMVVAASCYAAASLLLHKQTHIHMFHFDAARLLSQ